MSSKVINSYGEEIKLFFDGVFYKATGKNNETYISNDEEAVIAAFIEDVYKDGQDFTSIRNYKTYKAHFSEKLTKRNDGKSTYSITECKDYLT